MKIAFTADCHLTTTAKNPERFQALANIFHQCKDNGVQLLVIAGDLFDKDLPNFAEFEELYRNVRPVELTTVIIPGNHDLRLSQGALIGDGLLVYSSPTLLPLDDSRKILFLPYHGNQTMGELIAAFSEELEHQRWILVGHGDWTGSRNTPDPYEKGVYQPLTRTDLDAYQPELVILGHIHLAQDDKKVYYPGSPCPLNISETGMRRFLILDTDQGEITSHRIDSPLCYFDERFVMLPTKNGLDLLLTEISNRINGWHVPKGWEKRVQVRVKITGSSSIARDEVLAKVIQSFKDYSLYNDKLPDLSSLIYGVDQDRTEISNQIKNWIDDLDWSSDDHLPTKNQILERALKVIHGVEE